MAHHAAPDAVGEAVRQLSGAAALARRNPKA
jgi:hypothetical protein